MAIGMKKNSSWEDGFYFGKNHKGADGVNRSKIDMWEDLQKLNLETALPEDVESIVGKGNLARIFCNECHKEVQEAIMLQADESDIHLCSECLLTASKMLNKL